MEFSLAKLVCVVLLRLKKDWTFWLGTMETLVLFKHHRLKVEASNWHRSSQQEGESIEVNPIFS